MKITVLKTFTSPNRHLVRNSPSLIILSIIAIMMFTSMFVEYDGLIVIVIGVLFIWLLETHIR